MTAGWTPSPLEQDRRRYRRARARRSALISIVSSVAVLVIIVLVVINSPGWPRVRDSFFAVGKGADAFGGLIEALWVNIQIFVITEILVLVFALLIAFARTLQGPAWFPLRALATIYVDVFRGVPLLVVLYIVGYGLPALRIQGVPDSPFVLGIIALTLTYTSYVAEVFRAGVESVHPGQRAAARSLGLTYAQTMRHVVFPQGLRRVLPPLLNDFVSLQKDTSLVSTLGLAEIVLTAQNDTARDFKFVYYVVAALIFVVLTVPFTRYTDWLARKQGWVGVSTV